MSHEQLVNEVFEYTRDTMIHIDRAPTGSLLETEV